MEKALYKCTTLLYFKHGLFFLIEKVSAPLPPPHEKNQADYTVKFESQTEQLAFEV